MPLSVQHSSTAQTDVNRARARDSGVCTAAQPVAYCSLAVSISLSLNSLVLLCSMQHFLQGSRNKLL
jgi:hypothetical protein